MPERVGDRLGYPTIDDPPDGTEEYVVKPDRVVSISKRGYSRQADADYRFDTLKLLAMRRGERWQLYRKRETATMFIYEVLYETDSNQD